MVVLPFAGAAFLGAGAAAVDFVTRPDLVLPKTLGTSTTAGACVTMLVNRYCTGFSATENVLMRGPCGA